MIYVNFLYYYITFIINVVIFSWQSFQRNLLVQSLSKLTWIFKMLSDHFADLGWTLNVFHLWIISLTLCYLRNQSNVRPWFFRADTELLQPYTYLPAVRNHQVMTQCDPLNLFTKKIIQDLVNLKKSLWIGDIVENQYWMAVIFKLSDSKVLKTHFIMLLGLRNSSQYTRQ